MRRLVDIVLSLVLLTLLSPLVAAVAVLVFWCDGAPVLYRAERMKTPHTAFMLWKFRTMTASPRRSGVTGGDKSAEITRLGRFLRRTRLDELPQLWNILRGDMGFVGPRPPLRLYVEAAPELYAVVLRARPGLTGLATLYFHRHEEWLLAQCETPEDTHETYLRRCVPRKGRLDILYEDNRSLCSDFQLLLHTIWAVFRR